MDKFRELQVQIESVIAKIDKQIKEKEEQIKDINDKRLDATQAISDMNKSFKEVNDKINTLSKIKDKSIIIYAFKEWIKGMIKEIKQYIENKQWLLAFSCITAFLITIACMGVFILWGGFSSVILLGFVISIVFLGSNTGDIIKLIGLKKEIQLKA